MDSSLTGTYGELVTGRYLRDRGYTIVDANYRCRFGEIDIIAMNDSVLAFVEVKTRAVSDSEIRAADAVDEGKRNRIIATSKFFLSKHGFSLQPRFDVAEVYLDGKTVANFNYIENAYN